MSIVFDPDNRIFQLNEANYKTKNYKNIDYYHVCVNNEKDIKTLSILNEETQNKEGKIIIKNRNGNGNINEITYENNVKSKILNSRDFEYFCYITESQNIDSICVEIYKKYIEKYVLLRANRMPNIDYLFDIYIMMNNIQCEKIYERFNEIYDKLIDIANIRLHFMHVKIDKYGYLYTNACIIC